MILVKLFSVCKRIVPWVPFWSGSLCVLYLNYLTTCLPDGQDWGLMSLDMRIRFDLDHTVGHTASTGFSSPSQHSDSQCSSDLSSVHKKPIGVSSMWLFYWNHFSWHSQVGCRNAGASFSTRLMGKSWKDKNISFSRGVPLNRTQSAPSLGNNLYYYWY